MGLILNAEQQEAVLHHTGPCMVTSVPGSGKTRVITERVVCLINKYNVDPKSILCITFTNKAAREMFDRISLALGDSVNVRDIWISTFHKLCLHILRTYGDRICLDKNFSILDADDAASVMTKIARMHDYKTDSWSINGLIKWANDYRECLIDFAVFRKELNYVQSSIIEEYISYLDKKQAIDFSGMIYKAWQILHNHKDVLDELGDKFQYVLQDEAQDSNKIQSVVIKMIAKSGNLFGVGDYNQSVYSFRGASPEHFLSMKKDFPNIKQIVLPNNYRSTPEILSIAQRLIRNNDEGKDVKLIACRQSGAVAKLLKTNTPDEESKSLADNIEIMKSKYNLKWSSFAILYRMNSLSRSPEIALRNRSIPYRIVGGFSFFNRSEIKNALAYMSLLINPNDSLSFAKAIQSPKRAIGLETIGKIERQHENTGTPLMDVCKNIKLAAKARASMDEFLRAYSQCRSDYESGMTGIHESASRLLKKTGFYDAVEKQSTDSPDDVERIENLKELIVGVAEYQNNNPEHDLSDYLQSIKLLTDQDKKIEDEDCVSLMSLHASKGLEFPSVHILGMEEHVLPHTKATKLSEVEEERRLTFVGVTRSMDLLNLYYCKFRKGFSSGPADPSRFLNEMGFAV